MKIDKVYLVKSSGTMEENINSAIDQLKKQGYKVVEMMHVDDGILLCLESINQPQGYTRKQLYEEQSQGQKRTGDNKATYKQIRYIKSLANDEQLADIDLDNLTRRQAGQLIGKLKKAQKQEQQPTEPEDNFNPEFNLSDLNKMNFNQVKIMNMLEHYLVPGYKTALIKTKDAKKYKLSDDTDWVLYDGKIDCYGHIESLKRPFDIDEWNRVKDKGYFMA